MASNGRRGQLGRRTSFPIHAMSASRFLRVALIVGVTTPLSAQGRAGFRLEETTIADIQAAFKAKALTCHALVQQYLDRIDAIDKKGPAINAIILTNPAALTTADSLDKRFAREGLTGPLHCIPVLVKDNFETKDLQTTAGSLALKGWVPQ